MHLFLYGPSGAGKTTLINTALRQANIAPAGFSTKKLPLPQSSPLVQAPLIQTPLQSPSLSQPPYVHFKQATHQVLLVPPDIGQAAKDTGTISPNADTPASWDSPGSLGGSPAASVSGRSIPSISPHPGNLVGLCGPAGIIAAYPRVFDTAGAALLENIPAGSLVLMDELGFLEKEAFLFQNRVLEVLDGPYRVLGVIKERSDPFLDRIKRHPLVQCLAVEAASRRQAAAQLRLFLGQ